MRSHGSLTCGRTIQEAMFYTYHLQKAAEAQVLALSMNQPLIIPNDEICKKTVKDLLTFEQNLGERDWQAWLRLINR
jgi:ribulose-5-phosphate 4-epimerase/fuculose-1-phosphate aldolase